MPKMRPYFIIFVILLNSIGSYSFIEQIIPAPKTCWYVNHDAGPLSLRIIKELQEAAVPISIVNSVYTNFHLHCDSYLLIRQNFNGIINLQVDPYFMRIKDSAIVDTRTILAYEGNDELNSRKDINFLKTAVLNVVVLAIINENECDNYYKIKAPHAAYTKEVHATAVISEVTRVFSFETVDRNITIFRPEAINEQKRLEVLFSSQIWNPLKRNVTLEVAYHIHPPFVKIKPDAEDELDGVEYRIVEGVTKNWRINIKPFNYYSNASTVDASKFLWDIPDIFEFMNSAKSDISLTAMCTWVVLGQAKTSRVYSIGYTTMLVPRPRPVDTANYLYLPLNWSTWVCFIISFFLASCILYLFAKFFARSHHTEIISSNILYEKIDFCIMSLLEITCGQGILVPKTYRLRVILAIWMFASLLVGTSYLTGYSSFMTKQKFTSRIRTAEQFVKAGIHWDQHTIEPYNRYGAATLLKTGNPYWMQVPRFTSPYPQSPEEIKKRFHSGKHGTLCRRLSLRYVVDLTYTNDEVTYLMEPMEDFLEYCFFVFLMSPRTPFLHAFDARLSAAFETGLIEQWMYRALRQEKDAVFERSIYQSRDSAEPLNISNIKGAFQLLLGGYCLAIVCFIGELIYYRNEQQKYTAH